MIPKVLSISLFIFIYVLTSCTKSVDYSKDISDLKLAVSNLQKRSDSLATVLNNSNTNLNNLGKTVDSIKSQISFILSQLTSLNSQLVTANANITSINSQILILNQQYADLLIKLNGILAQLALEPNCLSEGLLAYYPFNGNAGDSSGNGNHGTVNGATLSEDRFGNFSKAYKFGTRKTIIVNNPSSALNLTGSFSISSWFKFDTLATLYNGSMLISKHDGDIGSDGWTYGIWNPNHNLQTQILNFQANDQFNTSTYPDSTGIVGASVWINFIVTYDLQNQLLKYYKNGKLVLSKNILFKVINNPKALTIGFQNSSSGTYLNYFRGSIDDIRIYGRVLAAAEIEYLSNH